MTNYTPDQLDRMRAAVRNLGHGQDIEVQLGTYVLAGVSPEELEQHVAKRAEMRVRRQMDLP